MSYSEKKLSYIITILSAKNIVYWFAIVLVFPATFLRPFKKYADMRMIFCDGFVYFQGT